MVSTKLASLCKFREYYRWPAQDCLNWSDHCNLLFLHESMLWLNHCKSTLWLNVCANMWIIFNLQNTSKSGWKSSSFFYPEKVFFLLLRMGEKNYCCFIIIFLREKITKKFQCHNILRHGGYLLSKDQKNTLVCFRGIANLKFEGFFIPFHYILKICYTSKQTTPHQPRNNIITKFKVSNGFCLKSMV